MYSNTVLVPDNVKGMSNMIGIGWEGSNPESVQYNLVVASSSPGSGTETSRDSLNCGRLIEKRAVSSNTGFPLPRVTLAL
jgi:hypothetical protein